MPHGGGDGLGEILADVVGGEEGPGGKVAIADGLGPGGCGWAEAGGVEESDEFRSACGGDSGVGGWFGVAARVCWQV
jgi:hypothetical protein